MRLGEGAQRRIAVVLADVFGEPLDVGVAIARSSTRTCGASRSRRRSGCGSSSGPSPGCPSSSSASRCRRTACRPATRRRYLERWALVARATCSARASTCSRPSRSWGGAGTRTCARAWASGRSPRSARERAPVFPARPHPGPPPPERGRGLVTCEPGTASSPCSCGGRPGGGQREEGAGDSPTSSSSAAARRARPRRSSWPRRGTTWRARGGPARSATRTGAWARARRSCDSSATAARRSRWAAASSPSCRAGASAGRRSSTAPSSGACPRTRTSACSAPIGARDALPLDAILARHGPHRARSVRGARPGPAARRQRHADEGGRREARLEGARHPPQRRRLPGQRPLPRGVPHAAKQSMEQTYLPRAAKLGARVLPDHEVRLIETSAARATAVSGRRADGSPVPPRRAPRRRPRGERDPVAVHPAPLGPRPARARRRALPRAPGHGRRGHLPRSRPHLGGRDAVVRGRRVPLPGLQDGGRGPARGARGRAHARPGRGLPAERCATSRTWPCGACRCAPRRRARCSRRATGRASRTRRPGATWSGSATGVRRLVRASLRGGRGARLPRRARRPGRADVARRAGLARRPPARSSRLVAHLGPPVLHVPHGRGRGARRRRASTAGVHGVHGLWVVDASVLPTNLGVNPQHTIMAVAMLMAERI